MKEKIDVYLLSGFLGSGKTTLLKHLIKDAKDKGQTPAVFMNELGELNFDSGEVEDGIPLAELLDGCICCTGSERSEAELQQLLAAEAFDVLFIETTGAAHPVEALDAVFSPLFSDRLHFRGIVTVADAKRYLTREELPPQIRMLFLEQIRRAGLVLLNKMDLLTESEQAEAAIGIQWLNPEARILQTVQSKVPYKELEQLQQQAVSGSETESGHKVKLQAKTLMFSAPVSREQFDKWLSGLPETVYRIKGYVPLEGDRYPYAFQYAYGLTNWLPEYMKLAPRLVVIGEGIEGVELP